MARGLRASTRRGRARARPLVNVTMLRLTASSRTAVLLSLRASFLGLSCERRALDNRIKAVEMKARERDEAERLLCTRATSL